MFFSTRYGAALLGLLCTASLFSQIKTIQSIEEAKPFIKSDSIVFIDLGYTLIFPSNPALSSYQGSSYFLHKTRNLPLEEFEYFGTLLTASTQWQLVESSFVDFVSFLKENNIFSACITGAGDLPFVGKIPYAPSLVPEKELPPTLYDYYLKVLKDLAIDFSTDSPLTSALLHLCSLKGCTYKGGVLFLNHQSMGSILPFIYNMLPFKASELVVIDEEMLYLRHLERACKESNIPFTGLYYRGFEKVKRRYDKTAAKVELDYLLKEKEVLSDEQANSVRERIKLPSE